jgi:hypothetical protein
MISSRVPILLARGPGVGDQVPPVLRQMMNGPGRAQLLVQPLRVGLEMRT